MELELKAVLEEGAKTVLKETKVPYCSKQSGYNIEYYIGHTRVTIRQGVVHSEVPAFGPMSEEIEPYIAIFKIEGSIDTRIIGKRRLGKYTLPSDKKVVCVVNPYIEVVHKFTIYGSDRDKVVELYGLIRDGKIMPDEEFGGTQDGVTREELERKLEVALGNFDSAIDQLKLYEESNKVLNSTNQKLLEQLQMAQQEAEELRGKRELSESTFRTHQQNSDKACEKNVRIRKLIDELLGKSADGSIFCWPLVSRRDVVDKIIAILDDK